MNTLAQSTPRTDIVLVTWNRQAMAITAVDEAAPETSVLQNAIKNASAGLSLLRSVPEPNRENASKAVARLVPLDQPRALDRLVAEGLVTPAAAAKRSRTPLRVTAKGTVSDLVAEQRQ